MTRFVLTFFIFFMNNIISHAMLLFKQIEQKFRTNSEFSLSAMTFLEIFLSFPGFP